MFIIYFFFIQAFQKLDKEKKRQELEKMKEKSGINKGKWYQRRRPENVLFINSTFIPGNFFSRKSVMYIVAHSTNNIQKMEV